MLWSFASCSATSGASLADRYDRVCQSRKSGRGIRKAHVDDGYVSSGLGNSGRDGMADTLRAVEG
jgi:hypothetical protein